MTPTFLFLGSGLFLIVMLGLGDYLRSKQNKKKS